VDGEKLNALYKQLVPISQLANTDRKRPSQEQINSLLEHYQKGRYDDAKKLTLSMTEQFPEHQFAWKVLGVTLQKTGRNSEALNANQTAV
jgi:predicted Zn-dependent protease